MNVIRYRLKVQDFLLFQAIIISVPHNCFFDTLFDIKPFHYYTYNILGLLKFFFNGIDVHDRLLNSGQNQSIKSMLLNLQLFRGLYFYRYSVAMQTAFPLNFYTIVQIYQVKIVKALEISYEGVHQALFFKKNCFTTEWALSHIPSKPCNLGSCPAHSQFNYNTLLKKQNFGRILNLSLNKMFWQDLQAQQSKQSYSTELTPIVVIKRPTCQDYYCQKEQPKISSFWQDFDQKKQNIEQEQFLFVSLEGKMSKVSSVKQKKTKVYVQKSKDQEQLQRAIAMGVPFDDASFPKNKSSIGDVEAMQQNIVWARLSELPDFRKMVVYDLIRPEDIIQQRLGDCYFLAGLATLAEFPQRIKKLIITKELNEQKYFQVKIMEKGVWRIITLDEYIPIAQGSQYPVFCSSKSREIWPIIFEKAWAKLFRSYHDIERGYLQQSLRALTGAPVQQLSHQKFKVDQLFDLFFKYDRLNYCMISSSNSGSNQRRDRHNIVMGHAYSLLSAAVIQVEGNTYRLLKLRNPWGQTESKARFCDDDPIWEKVPSQTKQKIGYLKKEDGICFMAIEQFVKSFHSTTVAKVHDDYSYVSCRQPHNFKNGMYFKVKIDRAGSYTFLFEQTSYRRFGKQKYNYKPNDLTLLIGQVCGQKIKYFQGQYNNTQCIQKCHELEPGLYIVYMKDNNANGMEKPSRYSLNVYGQFACEIVSSSKAECQNFIREYVTDATLRFGKRQSVGADRVVIQHRMKEGYSSFYIQNQQDRPLKLFIEIEPSPEYHFKHEFKGKQLVELVATKGKPGIAICRSRTSRIFGLTVRKMQATG